MSTKINQLRRGAGILLPISSLPSNYGIGTLGEEAYKFIDFMKKAGQKYWQVLPIGPTSYGDSPYQSFSAFAGNPYFIDLDILVGENLLTKDDIAADWLDDLTDVNYSKIYQSRFKVLKIAHKNSKHKDTLDFKKFCEQNKYWLEDYSFYMAVKLYFDSIEWLKWPEDIRVRKPEAIEKYRKILKDEIDFWKFCQYKFFEQWENVKQYANKNGIKIIGDIPIYISLDSSDVWAGTKLFQLDEECKPTKVAGVPPDNFSDDGQLWGNPLYNWEYMEKENFAWWKKRMKFSARIYDIIRIDHFIGVVKYYAIPAGEKTAVNGKWMKGPGKKLTDAIDTAIGDSQIIAEDLGVFIPAVGKLLQKTGYPGMKILQFAFDGNPDNEHLPYNYTKNYVVYGGTHDNETLVGFFKNKKSDELKFVMDYLNIKKRSEIPWAIIRTAYESVASIAMFQAQDLLELPNSARMNFPSTIGTNWRWRLKKDQLTDVLALKLQKLTKVYGR